MPGNRVGGLKAAEKNKKLHGKDFYRNIGRKGGQNGHTGGFYGNPELAKKAGQKGGLISRRGPALKDKDGNCITKDGRRYSGKRGKIKVSSPTPEKPGFLKRVLGIK